MDYSFCSWQDLLKYWVAFILLLIDLGRGAISVSPRVADPVTIHSNFSFKCSAESAAISWILPSGEVVTPGNISSDKRIAAVGQSLSVSNASLSDSGKYYCKISGSKEGTGFALVYVPISNRREVIALGIVDIALLAGLICFFMLGHCKQKKHRNFKNTRIRV